MGATAEFVRRWAALYNDGSPDEYGSDAFLQLYADDVDWVESPTVVTPEGRSGDLRALREAVGFGRSLFRHRRIAIYEMVEEGNRAIWIGTWSATIAVEGLAAPIGARIEVRQAMLIEIRDGRIVRQRDILAAPIAVTPALEPATG